jgi:hypothetical protein
LKSPVDACYLRGDHVFYYRPAAYTAKHASRQAAGNDIPPARIAAAQLQYYLVVVDWLLETFAGAEQVT